MTLNTNFAGRLVNNPEMQTIQTQHGEQLVTNFRMATHSYRKNEDYFLNCHIWGRAGYSLLDSNDHDGVHKGDQLFVNGECWTRQYQDRNGVERTSLEMDIASFDFGRKVQRTRGEPDQHSMAYDSMPPSSANNQPVSTTAGVQGRIRNTVWDGDTAESSITTNTSTSENNSQNSFQTGNSSQNVADGVLGGHRVNDQNQGQDRSQETSGGNNETLGASSSQSTSNSNVIDPNNIDF